MHERAEFEKSCSLIGSGNGESLRYASMISLVAFHFFHKLQGQLSSKTISKWNLAVITALNCSGISGGTATLSCEREKKHEKGYFRCLR